MSWEFKKKKNLTPGPTSGGSDLNSLEWSLDYSIFKSGEVKGLFILGKGSEQRDHGSGAGLLEIQEGLVLSTSFMDCSASSGESGSCLLSLHCSCI